MAVSSQLLRCHAAVTLLLPRNEERVCLRIGYRHSLGGVWVEHASQQVHELGREGRSVLGDGGKQLTPRRHHIVW